MKEEEKKKLSPKTVEGSSSDSACLQQNGASNDEDSSSQKKTKKDKEALNAPRSSLFGRFTNWVSQKDQQSKESSETESPVKKEKTDRELSPEKSVKENTEVSTEKSVKAGEELLSEKSVETAAKKTVDKTVTEKKSDETSTVSQKKQKVSKVDKESSKIGSSVKETKTDGELSPEKSVKENKEVSTEKSVKTEVKEEAEKSKGPSIPQVKLKGLFAFKVEMTSFYEDGKSVPVTALYYEPWRVSQIKTRDKEGYSAVQLACWPQKNGRCSKPLTKHLIAAGFKEGARYIREFRQQELPKDIQVGHELSIQSLSKGDVVKLSSRSKGRGFSGVMKRWGFSGGKASHGAKTHRKAGSIGQHTEPSRVFAGKKMPGHYGFQNMSLKKVEVVDVLPKENLIFVKGPVPGSRNTLVTLKKMEIS